MPRSRRQTGAMVLRLLYDGSSGEAGLARSSRQVQQFQQDIANSLLGIGVTGAAALGSAALVAADYETAVSGLRRVTGLSAVDNQLLAMSIADLRDQYDALAPIGEAQLVQIGEIGARSGLAAIELQDFVTGIAALSVASGQPVELLAGQVTAFQNATGGATDDTLALSSAVAELGNTTGTSEEPILRASGFLGGLATTAGLSRAEILALSATVAETLPRRLEGGAGSVNRLFAEMADAVREGGDELDVFAAVAGTSADDFATTWTNAPLDAVQQFLAGINTLGTDALPVLDAVGITSVEQANNLASLASNADGLAGSVANATRAYQDQNVALDEAAIQAETLNEQARALREDLRALGVDVGDDLLPVLKDVVAGVRFAVDGFDALPAPIRRAVVLSATLTTGLTLLTGGALRARAAFIGMRTELNLMATRLAATGGAATTAATGLSLASRALGPLGLALGIGVPLLLSFRDANRESNDELARTPDVADAAATAIARFNGTAPVEDRLDIAGLEEDLETLNRLGQERASILNSLVIFQAEFDRRVAASASGEEFFSSEERNALTGFLENLGLQLGIVDGQISQITEGTSAFSSALESTDLSALLDLQDQTAPGSRAYRELEEQISAVVGETVRQEELQSRVNGLLADARGEAGRLAGELDNLSDAFRDLTGSQIGTSDAVDSVIESGRELLGQLADNATALRGSSDAALENRAAIRGFVQDALDAGEAVAEQTGSIDAGIEATARFIQELLSTADAAGISTGAVRAYLETLGLTPTQIRTELSADADVSSINRILEALEQIPRLIRVGVAVVPATAAGATTDLIGGRPIGETTGGGALDDLLDGLFGRDFGRVGGSRGGGGGGGGSTETEAERAAREAQEFFEANLAHLDLLFEIGDIDRAEYLRGLDARIGQEERLTANWVELWRRRSQELDAAAQAQADTLAAFAEVDQDLLDRIDAIEQTVIDGGDRLRNAVTDTADILDLFGRTDQLTEDEIVAALEHRAEAAEMWLDSLDRIRRQGQLPADIIQQLALAGPESVGLANVLADSDQGRIAQILRRFDVLGDQSVAANLGSLVAGQLDPALLELGGRTVAPQVNGNVVQLGSIALSVNIEAGEVYDAAGVRELIEVAAESSLDDLNTQIVEAVATGANR